MEDFVVSARKYRPQTFTDVVGQHAITNTLQNAIKNNHLAQALLFCGPRGVGKTTCARILAKEINRSHDNFREEEDFAFNIFELDAASNNSVDDIRTLTDQVRIPPQVGKYKVYIIDEVHMLSQAAFNAFLKTLEEPPKHAIFILATTEKHKIIPTILSRCQIFDFKRITIKDAKAYLSYIAQNQGITAEDDALHIIAQKADGAMRDALSIFDRVVSFSGKKLTRQAVAENLNVLDYETYFNITDLLLTHNIPQVLLDFNEIIARGFDMHHFIIGLASHFRDLMVCQNEATVSLLEVGDETKRHYEEQSKKTAFPFLMKALELANECDLNYKASKNQRLLVELCLMQLASIHFDGEKKKNPPFIIPASHYQNNDANPKPYENKSQPETNSVKEPVATYSEALILEQKPALAQIDLKEQSYKVSGLSLSSIKAKKKHEEIVQNQSVAQKNLPAEEITEEMLQKIWIAYIKRLENNGQKNMPSILSITLPKLKNKTEVWMEFPNETMKKEVEKDQKPLLEFLQEHLQNYSITLRITVNETVTEKYAFTPQEKYEKLRQKNPLIDTLRKEFDLEI
jgi:DNA polymerase III subunit gamma/tau